MKTGDKKIALVYFRTSTHQQFQKISPEMQKQNCIDFARREGFEVDESRDIYCDDESAFVGKKGKRDGFQEMTKRWREDKRVGAIIVYDISRLFRDVRGYLNYTYELEKNVVELLSVTEPAVRDRSPAGRLPAGVIALVNEYTSALYANKIKENMRFKAESGIYPGKAPYGYKNVREEGEGKKRAWIEVNEKEAPWVKKAFLLYSGGNHSLRTLTDVLSSEGFPTRNGRPLQLSVLERILKDRTYIGWIEWGSVSHSNGKHEKIVDQETFERVQFILAAHNKEANRERKHNFLLRGLMLCDECESRIQAGYSTGKSGEQYGHYFCYKRQHGRSVPCSQSSILIPELEKQFAMLFKQLELSPGSAEKVRAKIKKNFGERQQVYENTRKGLLLSIENIKSAKKRAFLKFANDEVDSETYDTAVADLEQQEKDLNNSLSRLEGDMSHIMRALEIGVELTQDIYRAYLKAPYPLKSLLAQAFFKNLRIRDGEIVSAELNAPLDYVCSKKLRGSTVFKLAYIGGDKRSLLEHFKRWQKEITLERLSALEKAYGAIQAYYSS